MARCSRTLLWLLGPHTPTVLIASAVAPAAVVVLATQIIRYADMPSPKRGAIYCSKPCRQAAHRLLELTGALAGQCPLAVLDRHCGLRNGWQRQPRLSKLAAAVTVAGGLAFTGVSSAAADEHPALENAAPLTCGSGVFLDGLRALTITEGGRDEVFP